MNSDDRTGPFYPSSDQGNDTPASRPNTAAMAQRTRWSQPGLAAAIVAATMASGAQAQDRNGAEALRRVEDAGHLTSTAAACGARRHLVDLVVERAVREAIQSLAPSRTGEALGAAWPRSSTCNEAREAGRPR